MATEETIGDGRPQRACAVCGQVDDHPRHVIGRVAARSLPRPSAEVIDKVTAAVAGKPYAARVLTELLGERGMYRHMDCCRAAGCPDGSCNGAPDERGGALLRAIQAGEY